MANIVTKKHLAKMSLLACKLQLLELPVVIYYFAPLGLQSIVISLSVHLSVHSHNLKTMWPNFTKFFVHVASVMTIEASTMLWPCGG